MKTLITMTLSASVDGDDFIVSDDTQTHGNTWAEVYRGMVMLRDELDRQLADGRLCPFHPKYGPGAEEAEALMLAADARQ